MSIHPTKFHADGSFDIIHTDFGHESVATPANLHWGVLPNGQPDRRYLYLSCPFPGCDSESMHPVTGGAEAEGVQRMFMRAYQRLSPSRTRPQARAAIRVLIQQKAGLEFVRLNSPGTETDWEDA